MRFETDMQRLREAPFQFKNLKETLEQLRKDLTRLQEQRAAYNKAEPMPYEEWLRTEKHIHSITPENEERYQKSYQQYLDMQSRRKQDALSQLDIARQRIQETLRKSSSNAQHLREREQELVKAVRLLEENLAKIGGQLSMGARQLSLEQIAHIRHLLDSHDWTKPSD